MGLKIHGVGHLEMFLEGYSKEIIRAKCNPQFESVHCIAHLSRDIRDVLPYLNTVLGGYTYIDDPPSVTFKLHGKLITVHAQEIAVNALQDEREADKVLTWLQQQINETWERRDEILPSFESLPRPRIIEVLKLLPKTNCKKCGQPTCMVFATLVAEGAKVPEDCPALDEPNRGKMVSYLAEFRFDL
jgi:ArsR family metal-binding transcriptional regulator